MKILLIVSFMLLSGFAAQAKDLANGCKIDSYDGLPGEVIYRVVSSDKCYNNGCLDKEAKVVTHNVLWPANAARESGQPAVANQFRVEQICKDFTSEMETAGGADLSFSAPTELEVIALRNCFDFNQSGVIESEELVKLYQYFPSLISSPFWTADTRPNTDPQQGRWVQGGRLRNSNNDELAALGVISFFSHDELGVRCVAR